MSTLLARGLEKAYGSGRDTVPVLRGVDLEVPAGSLTAVLGPSGCGKTTLLRLIAGFVSADAGRLSLDGRVVSSPGTHVAPERRRVGVVPQEGALFPHLTVAGNVGFGLSRASRRGGRVGEVLDLVGLHGFGERMPHELSGGQQQRVALARALAPGPALVLLDEPFAALDTGLRAMVREEVRRALRDAGATAVLVTHDQEEALSMADQVAVLSRGRIAQAAAPGQLYREPVALAVATFVVAAVVMDAVACGGHADTPLGRLPLRGPVPAGPGRAVLRPEQVQLVGPGSGVVAVVTGTTYYGHDDVVRLRISGPTEDIDVSARRQGAPEDLRAGDAVGLLVRGEASFFPRPAAGVR